MARIGVEGFKQLLLSTGKNLTPPLWQKAREAVAFEPAELAPSLCSPPTQVTNCILELFKENMPRKLMEVDKAWPGVWKSGRWGLRLKASLELPFNEEDVVIQSPTRGHGTLHQTRTKTQGAWCSSCSATC